MKLWKLMRVGDTGYDEYIGYVVRAEDEHAARLLVNWLEAEAFTCEELNADGEAEIVLDSFRAG